MSLITRNRRKSHDDKSIPGSNITALSDSSSISRPTHVNRTVQSVAQVHMGFTIDIYSHDATAKEKGTSVSGFYLELCLTSDYQPPDFSHILLLIKFFFPGLIDCPCLPPPTQKMACAGQTGTFLVHGKLRLCPNQLHNWGSLNIVTDG